MQPAASFIQRGVFCLGLVICLLTSRASLADTDNARVLFREGKQLAASGLYEAAHAKFAQSLSLESGVGTQYQIADCLERLGRTASARAAFLKAAEMARELHQEKREQAAADRADALLSRLSRLRIQCDGTCPGELRVLRGDVAMSETSWQTPKEVDPGIYRIEANLADGTRWIAQVEIPIDPGITFVAIPAMRLGGHSRGQELQRLTRKPLHASTSVRPEIKPRTRDVSPSSDVAGQETSLFPKVMLWVGVGSLALGGASALALHDKNSQAKDVCPSSLDCTTSEIQRHDGLVDQAKLYRAGVYAGVGLGLSALATAALAHYVLGPRSRERSPTQGHARIAPIVSDRTFGFSAFVGGEF